MTFINLLFAFFSLSTGTGGGSKNPDGVPGGESGGGGETRPDGEILD